MPFNSLNMKPIILIFAFLSLLSFEQETDGPFYKYRGQIVDSLTGDSLPFLGLKLFVNDTLRGYGITGLDGKYVIVCQYKFDTINKFELEFHSQSGIFKDMLLKEYNGEIISKHVNDTSFTYQQKSKWVRIFKASMPNYLDCHPEEPYDEFEIKNTSSDK